MLDECVQHGFDGAMVRPCWVPLATDQLAGTDVSVCTELGCPLGGDSTLAKVTGIRDALAEGGPLVEAARFACRAGAGACTGY